MSHRWERFLSTIGTRNDRFAGSAGVSPFISPRNVDLASPVVRRTVGAPSLSRSSHPRVPRRRQVGEFTFLRFVARDSRARTPRANRRERVGDGGSRRGLRRAANQAARLALHRRTASRACACACVCTCPSRNIVAAILYFVSEKNNLTVQMFRDCP